MLQFFCMMNVAAVVQANLHKEVMPFSLAMQLTKRILSGSWRILLSGAPPLIPITVKQLFTFADIPQGIEDQF